MLAVAAARLGGRVTAVDISCRAVVATWINAPHHGDLRLCRGELTAAGPGGRRFDLVIADADPLFHVAEDRSPGGSGRHGRGDVPALQTGRPHRRLLRSPNGCARRRSPSPLLRSRVPVNDSPVTSPGLTSRRPGFATLPGRKVVCRCRCGSLLFDVMVWGARPHDDTTEFGEDAHGSIAESHELHGLE
ncbi:hypothetical protein ABT215_09825 [Streptomyces sp900105755]|uniref:hypothetical protein n=1 Tax=Streptomyces sp. 900105755 TaxID=3154389 RepID=UPI00331FB1D0